VRNIFESGEWGMGGAGGAGGVGGAGGDELLIIDQCPMPNAPCPMPNTLLFDSQVIMVK